MPDDVRVADPVHAEVRALRAAVEALAGRVARLEARRVHRDHPALADALEGFFGEGRFTVQGLLAIADDDPHSQIGVALADLIDLSASPRSRATALGVALSRMPDVEVVAAVRGSAVYRLTEVR